MIVREYPAASDRSGKDADFKNYPTFLQNLRKALDGTGLKFGLSITIVSGHLLMRTKLTEPIAIIILVHATF